MSTITETPQCWSDFADVVSAGIDRIILFGPPGTGKTYAGLNEGNVSAGSYRLVCTDDMTAADVTGCWMPAGNDGWKWLEGAAVKAWRGNGQVGGRLVIDEIDKASGDVLSLLLAMTDSVESAEWEHPSTGEKVKPLEGFSVVMTTNLEDMSDLPEALKDRFPVSLRINTPHPGALLGLSPDLRGPAAGLADAERQRRFSVRSFQAFDNLRASLGEERAAKLIFGQRSQDILDALKVDRLGV